MTTSISSEEFEEKKQKVEKAKKYFYKNLAIASDIPAAIGLRRQLTQVIFSYFTFINQCFPPLKSSKSLSPTTSGRAQVFVVRNEINVDNQVEKTAD